MLLLLYVDRKWFPKRNLATILALKSKSSVKHQCLYAIDGGIKMRKKASKISNKMKNLNKMKHFMRPKQRGTLRKLSSSPPNKSFPRLWSKNVSYGDLQKFAFQHLLSKCFVNPFFGCLEMMQWNFFWYQPKTCFLKNFKSE